MLNWEGVNVLEVKELCKTIDRTAILQDISFSIVPGTITGIIGRNGAGKTTLLRTMSGILLPDSGEVCCQGQNIHTRPEVKVNILFIPDTKNLLLNYTPLQFSRLYALIYPNFDQDAFAGWLEQFRLPVNQKVRYFSKGMKSLFYLSLAFAARTEAVLLDEPTEGLDPIFKKECLKLIVQEVAERKPAVLISSHRLEELQAICDQVIFLRNGTIELVTDLMTMQERYQKLQAVYQEGLPDNIKSRGNVRVLSQSGRVYTLLLEGDLRQTREQLEASGPILLEDLPLSLEDLFVSKLGGDDLV